MTLSLLLINQGNQSGSHMVSIRIDKLIRSITRDKSKRWLLQEPQESERKLSILSRTDVNIVVERGWLTSPEEFLGGSHVRIPG